MTNAFQFVLDTLTSAWNWLASWNFHNVSFAFYIVGMIVLGMLIRRLFG